MAEELVQGEGGAAGSAGEAGGAGTAGTGAAGGNGGDGAAGNGGSGNGGSLLAGAMGSEQEGGKPGGKEGEAGGESGKESGKASGAVPEKYELEIPASLGIDGEALDSLMGNMRELGFSNAQAQGVVAMALKSQESAMTQYAGQVAEWTEAVKVDPEIGGPKLAASLAYSAAALREFDPEQKVFGMLEASGYANHPDVVRVLARIGRAVKKEDEALTGRSGGSLPPLEQRLYPGMRG